MATNLKNVSLGGTSSSEASLYHLLAMLRISGVCGCTYLPVHSGLRFSRKAHIPSWASAKVALKDMTSFV